MCCARELRVVLLAAVFLLGPCAPASAESPLERANALDDGILAAEALLEDRKCKQGLALLKETLAQHEGQDYAKARRAEIEELIFRLACGTTFKLPKAKDLVSGDLQRWSPDTGKIKIRYTPKQTEDLEKQDGMHMLPARFDGPLLFELKGSSYPSGPETAPRVTFGGDPHPETGKIQTWQIDFASAQIVYVDGGESETVAKKKSWTAGKVGKKYRLKVRIAQTRISASLNGRTLGSAKKDESVYGFLRFSASKWTEAKLSGTIDPAWIRTELEVKFRDTLKKFKGSYKKSEHVPAWLSEPPSRESSKPSSRPVDLVARLSEKHYTMMMDVDNHVRQDEFDEALALVDKMQASGVPEATCEYLRAEASRFENKLEDSLAHLKRCLELEPAYVEAFLKRGRLLRELGRFDEALAVFEQVAGAHAEVPSTYETAASAMLLAGRPDDARRMTRLAARNGVWSPQLVTLNDALSKILHGPDWERMYEHKSRNYHVLTDINQVLCLETSRLLEESFDAFRRELGWVDSDKTRRFRVYLFDTQESFMKYQGSMQDYMGKPVEWAAGLYSPLLKQLLIWNPRDPRQMNEIIRHEGFHQYLDRVMANPPTWLNEGLAVYHETGERKDGKLEFGKVDKRYVRALSFRGLLPLEKFIFGGAHTFYEKRNQSYGQAWLLVHMLRHTKPEYKAIFDGLVEDLKTGASFGVLRKWFPVERIGTMEKDLRAYLEKLNK